MNETQSDGMSMDKKIKIKKDTCYFCQFEFENITLTKVETRNDMFYWICENCSEENFVDDDNIKLRVKQ